MNVSGVQVVTMGKLVSAIGNNVFRECETLNTVFLPASISYVGNNPFPSNTVAVVKPDSYAYWWAEENNQPYIIDTGQ